MSSRVRVLGTLVLPLVIAAVAAPSVAAASGAAPPHPAPGTPAAVPCPLAALTEISQVAAVVPSVVDVLANDCEGAATASRPLTITAVGQGTYGSVTTDGRTVVYDPRGCTTGDASGNDLFTYTITDGVTSKSGVALVHVNRPAAAPVTDTPQAGFVAGSLVGPKVPLRVSWCGVTSGVAVKGYRVEQGANGGASFPSLVTAATKAAAASRPVAPATNAAWRVRTTDALNRVGGYASSLTSRVTVIGDQSTAIKYSAGWSTAKSSRYLGGRERYTSKAGATATLTVTNVRAVAIAASRAPRRGGFHVYVDNVRVTATPIKQGASKAAWRRVLYIRGLTSGAGVTHKIQVRAVGNGRIGLDAILTLSGKRDQALTFTTPAPTNATYAGASHEVAATASSGLPVTLSIHASSWAVCSLDAGVVSYHGAGTCRIDARQPGDMTWNARTVSRVFTVAPIALTVSGITAQDRPYNGTTAASLVLGGADLDETPVVPGDVVALSTAGATGSFANAAVGSNKPVQVAGLALTGADAANYAITQPVTTASITPRNLTVSFTALDRPYDGTTVATIASCSVATVLAGDTVTCDASGATAAFADAEVGEDKTVTGSGFALAGADAANYAIGAVNTTTASIAPLDPQEIAFDLTGVEATYGDGPVAISATATSGLPVTFASLTGGVCTVAGGEISIVTSGTCTIRASQPGNATYAAAPNVEESLAVAKRAITVTAVAATKTADGTTASSGVPTITGGSLRTGDSGAWTQAFDNAAAGTGKTLTPSGIVTRGVTNVTAHYAVTFVNNTSGVIQPGAASVATSTVEASPADLPADGVSESTITVRLRDAFGNQLTASGGTVTIVADDGVVGPVTDHGNGTATATYTSATDAGEVTVSALLNGNPIVDTATISLG